MPKTVKSTQGRRSEHVRSLVRIQPSAGDIYRKFIGHDKKVRITTHAQIEPV